MTVKKTLKILTILAVVAAVWVASIYFVYAETREAWRNQGHNEGVIAARYEIYKALKEAGARERCGGPVLYPFKASVVYYQKAEDGGVSVYICD